MTVSSGMRLGPFEVLRELGRGGMPALTTKIESSSGLRRRFNSAAARCPKSHCCSVLNLCAQTRDTPTSCGAWDLSR
jgi:hypothetical protein